MQQIYKIYYLSNIVSYVIVVFIKQRRLPTIYNQIISRNQYIKKRLEKIKRESKNFPPDTITCKTHGHNSKWYIRTKDGEKYLRKENKELAQTLAYKKYLQALENDLEAEYLVNSTFLKNYSKCHSSQKFLNHDSPYAALLTGYYQSHHSFDLSWCNSTYEKNEMYPEHLIYHSLSGNVLRSKSESLIDFALFANQISYRYEAALYIAGTTYYPDFIIRHPVTGEIYYWEHFGMMDTPQYCKKAFDKLKVYALNGIIPTINLIVTFETTTSPLTSETINEIIHKYFL